MIMRADRRPKKGRRVKKKDIVPGNVFRVLPAFARQASLLTLRPDGRERSSKRDAQGVMVASHLGHVTVITSNCGLTQQRPTVS